MEVLQGAGVLPAPKTKVHKLTEAEFAQLNENITKHVTSKYGSGAEEVLWGKLNLKENQEFMEIAQEAY